MTITKKFHINNGFDAGTEYEVSTCTAIAASIGETERTEALYVHYYAESGEHVEFVVWNWEMPEDEDEFLAMCEDSSAWDGWHGTLETVGFEFYAVQTGDQFDWDFGSYKLDEAQDMALAYTRDPAYDGLEIRIAVIDVETSYCAREIILREGRRD